MTTDWTRLQKRYQVYFYGLCQEHYGKLDERSKESFLFMVPYSVPAHQIYRCCGKNSDQYCEEYIKHTDKTKNFYVHGTTPSPPR